MSAAASHDWNRTVAWIRGSSTRAGRKQTGFCSLEGYRLFERALHAGVPLPYAVTNEAFLASKNPREKALFDLLQESGCQLQAIPEEVLQSLIEGRGLGPVVGLARLPEAPSLKDLCAPETGVPPIFLGLVGVDDPGNIGALLRTAHASGARGVLAVGAGDAFHPKSVRTSMGSVFRVPFLTWDSLAELTSELKSLGIRSAGAVLQDGVSLAGFEFGATPWAMFLGSESFGLSSEDRQLFDAGVTIPMAGPLDSFSVNAAASVLLWELRRKHHFPTTP